MMEKDTSGKRSGVSTRPLKKLNFLVISYHRLCRNR
jgi:hypothetical protein